MSINKQRGLVNEVKKLFVECLQHARDVHVNKSKMSR